MNHEQLNLETAVSISKAMQALYGDSFSRKWADVTENNAKPEKFISALQFGLAGLSLAQIKHGLQVMRDKTFAPTIPEFRVWCLEGSTGKFLDVDTAYVNAANEKYTDAATYEAARRTGFWEVRSRSELSIKPIFKKHYSEVCSQLEINPNAFELPKTHRIKQAPMQRERKDSSFFESMRRGLA
ncbi:MAG: hypothetical protein KGI50_07635 [Patescibacteria group bacterium]|nr:hypothetical protein [Patescibacteria group bacterium]